MTIKGQMISEVGGEYIFKILTEAKPEIGKSYFFDDATDKTRQQHKAIEAMIREWYISGQHCAPEGLSYPLFRHWVKCQHGEVLGHVPGFGAVPKSLTDYTKEELSNFISVVKSDVCNTMRPMSKKMEIIFRGMERI